MYFLQSLLLAGTCRLTLFPAKALISSFLDEDFSLQGYHHLVVCFLLFQRQLDVFRLVAADDGEGQLVADFM